MQLKNKILTIPNALSGFRLAASPVIASCLLSGTASESYKTGLILCAAAGLSDFLDGAIARRFASQKSKIGTVLDPIADKTFVMCTTLSLMQLELMPMPLVSLIIGRDIFLSFGTLFLRYRNLGVTKMMSFWKYPTHVKPHFTGKMNTTVQFVLLGSTLISPIYTNISILLPYIQFSAVASTLLSTIVYARNPGKYVINKSLT